MTTRTKKGKPARWPWRSRLDVFFFPFSAVGISGFLFFFLFFWRFSGAFLSCYPSTPAPSPPPTIPSTSPSTSPPHQTLSTPAPFPPLISPSPFARFPYLDIQHSSTNFLLPPPLVFFFSFSGAFTTAEISRKAAQHTPAPSSAPTATSSSASGPVDARLALLSLHGWTVFLHRILIPGYLGGSGGKKWALA